MVCVEKTYLPYEPVCLNPFTLNGISHNYQWDHSFCILRVAGWTFFIFIKILTEHFLANSKEITASDLGQHCLPMSHKKDASLICVIISNYKTVNLECVQKK